MRSVIMFHGVQPEPSALTINKEELTGILTAVRDNGYAFKPLPEVMAAGPEDPVVALTFDDAFQTVNDAAEILADFDAPATLFVVTNWVGKTNQWPGQTDNTAAHRLLSWDELRAFQTAGWDIQAHTHNHPDLRQLPDKHILREVEACKSTLREQLGIESTTFAYPYGYVNRRVYDLVKTHFDVAMTTMLSDVPADCDPHLVPRIDAQYIWPAPVHFYFGRWRFRAYLQTRQQLRRWQSHPGEPVPSDWI